MEGYVEETVSFVQRTWTFSGYASYDAALDFLERISEGEWSEDDGRLYTPVSGGWGFASLEEGAYEVVGDSMVRSHKVAVVAFSPVAWALLSENEE